MLSARVPAGTALIPGDFHFFAEDGLIAYDNLLPVGDQGGAFVFILPMDDSAPANAPLHRSIVRCAGPLPRLKDYPLSAESRRYRKPEMRGRATCPAHLR